MKKIKLIWIVLVCAFLLSGCDIGMNGTGTELALIMPSGTIIKCSNMEEEDLLKIEGTTDYKFTYEKDKEKLYIKNKEGKIIFEQKKVHQTTYRTYRGSMDEDGTLWICIEKWDIGGWYMGPYYRGYLEDMPVKTDIWQIEPESGEVLFHEKENHFYLTQNDGWLYFYKYGSEETRFKEEQNASVIRKPMDDWDKEEVVKDMGFVSIVDGSRDLYFEIGEESITISATEHHDVDNVGPIIVPLED